MNKNKLELYKGVFSAFTTRGISIIAGYIFSFLIAFYYGAKGVGIFSISQTLIVISSILSVLGFDVAIIRFFSENKSIPRIKMIYLKILKLVIPLAFLISIIVYFTSSLLADFFNDKDLLYSIKYASFGILPLSLIFINAESLRAMKKIKSYSLLKYAIIPSMASIVLFVIFNSKILNLEGIIASYVFAIYFTFILSLFFLLREINIMDSDEGTIPFKDLLNISLPMLLTSSLFYVINWTDTIVLGYYDTAYNIGIYNISLKMSMASSIVLFSVNSIAAPKYSELYFSKKFIEFKSIVRFSSKLIFWISIPIITIIAYKADFFLNIFGEEFKQGKAALYILLIGQFVNISCGSVGYILMMTDKQIILRNIIILTALINLFLNIILIPSYGIIGAAIATTVAMILWNIISLIYVYKEHGFITISIIK